MCHYYLFWSFLQFSSMRRNSTYVRYHQYQILVVFRNHLCSFSFLGLTLPWMRLVALCEVLLQILLRGTETQWLLLPSVQIFQAVSKTTTLSDLFKQFKFWEKMWIKEMHVIMSSHYRWALSLPWHYGPAVPSGVFISQPWFRFPNSQWHAISHLHGEQPGKW